MAARSASAVCQVVCHDPPIQHERRTEPMHIEAGGDTVVAIVSSGEEGQREVDVLVAAGLRATDQEKSDALVNAWLVLAKTLAADPNTNMYVQSWCAQVLQRVRELGAQVRPAVSSNN